MKVNSCEGPLLFDKRSQDVVGVVAVTEAEVEEDIMMGVTVVDTEAVSFQAQSIFTKVYLRLAT